MIICLFLFPFLCFVCVVLVWRWYRGKTAKAEGEIVWSQESLAGLADAVWAFGTLEISCSQLLVLIEGLCVMDGPIRDFSAQDLSNTVWALARLRYEGRPHLMAAIVCSSFPLLSHLPSYPQEKSFSVHLE
jgi:hypothetical protein